VPKKGALSFYYCREEAVIETVSKRGCYDSSDYPYAINGEIPGKYLCSYVTVCACACVCVRACVCWNDTR
jgi:hypothetical protein